jgi:hypothetical protein
MVNALKYIFILHGLLVFCSPSSAMDLFEDDTVVEVTLSGPLGDVLRHKADEQAFPFMLEAGGIHHRVMVSVRGNSRKRVCSFPPLKLEFESPPGKESVFTGQTSLKLVTHCNKSRAAQDNMLEEYAAYRIFNLLSDASYRVRLLKINYLDDAKKRSMVKMAFVIETSSALARRLGGRQAHLPAVSLKKMNDRQQALAYVFQYLIGNTDWSLVASAEGENCCHNGKLIEKEAELLYVPYDFDLSGLVDARYAYPDALLPIRSVTQRLYRGYCIDPPVLHTALRETKSKEAGFSDIIDNLHQLSASAKKRDHRYLGRFFEDADDEQKMLENFERRCLD